MREKVISALSTIKKLITIHSNQVFSNQKTFRPKNLSGQLLRESPRFPPLPLLPFVYFSHNYNAHGVTKLDEIKNLLSIDNMLLEYLSDLRPI